MGRILSIFLTFFVLCPALAAEIEPVSTVYSPSRSYQARLITGERFSLFQPLSGSAWRNTEGVFPVVLARLADQEYIPIWRRPLAVQGIPVAAVVSDDGDLIGILTNSEGIPTLQIYGTRNAYVAIAPLEIDSPAGSSFQLTFRNSEAIILTRPSGEKTELSLNKLSSETDRNSHLEELLRTRNELLKSIQRKRTPRGPFEDPAAARNEVEQLERELDRLIAKLIFLNRRQNEAFFDKQGELLLLEAARLFDSRLYAELSRRERSEKATITRQRLENVKAGLLSFQREHGRFPGEVESLEVLTIGFSRPASLRPTELLDGWNRVFVYTQAKKDINSVQLFSKGPDGLPNTPDDIPITFPQNRGFY